VQSKLETTQALCNDYIVWFSFICGILIVRNRRKWFNSNRCRRPSSSAMCCIVWVTSWSLVTTLSSEIDATLHWILIQFYAWRIAESLALYVLSRAQILRVSDL
jgi:hypothetical protein